MAEEGFWLRRSWWAKATNTAAGMWAATVLGFFGTVVAARGLGVRAYGEVVLALAVATVVGTLIDITIEEALVHHGFQALAANDYSRLRFLLRTGLLLDVLIGLIVFVALLIVANVLAELIDGGLQPRLLRVAALTVLAQTVNGTTSAALLLGNRPDLKSWAAAASNLLRLALVALSVSRGAPAVLYAIAIATAAGAATQGVLAIRTISRFPKAAPTQDGFITLIPTILKFAIHSSITSTVLAARSGVIPIVLGKFAGATAVGVFDVAQLPLSIAAVATSPLRLVLFTEQARLASEKGRRELQRSIHLHTWLGFLVGVPFAALGWFLLPGLIRSLYTEAFDAALWPARILLVAAIVHLATAWSKGFAPAIGVPSVRTKVNIIEFVGILILMGLLSRDGPRGAAFAISISHIVTGVVWWIVAARLLRPGLKWEPAA